MPGLLDRGIDRELGTTEEAERRALESRSWLNDWPLLLGLLLSAALIAASTAVGGSPPRPKLTMANPAASTAGGEIPGQVVDVGEGEDAGAAPVEAKPAKKQARKRGRSRPDAAAAGDSAPAPEETSGASGGNAAPRSPGRKRASSRRSGGSSGGSGGATTTGRIVNVTGTSATFSNGPMAYSFSAPTHKPVVGRKWRLQLAVKRGGAPATGTVKIDILHNGSVVGHAASGKLSAGRFAHDFDWPDRSAGVPLTVKTSIFAGGFQQSFLFKVQVSKAG